MKLSVTYYSQDKYIISAEFQKFSPEIAKIQFQKSGFLQITKTTYSVRKHFPKIRFLKLEDFRHENGLQWTCSLEPSGIGARNCPDALACILML